jgi:UDP-4-amino-4,6-dideoxy-N-acetyl-beta-L-altrosamine N-acetyltransferase
MGDYAIILEKFGEVELYNYVNLSEDDKTLVLNMRNHPEIKKWMYNQTNIVKKEHIKFIKFLESSVDRRYFLVKHKSKIIGSINFSEINLHDSAEFGIYTNPFLQFQGAGSLLESAASEYAFSELNLKKIKLEVFSDNKKAINFYNKCGYEFINVKKFNNQNTMCMEKMRSIEGLQ